MMENKKKRRRSFAETFNSIQPAEQDKNKLERSMQNVLEKAEIGLSLVSRKKKRKEKSSVLDSQNRNPEDKIEEISSKIVNFPSNKNNNLDSQNRNSQNGNPKNDENALSIPKIGIQNDGFPKREFPNWEVSQNRNPMVSQNETPVVSQNENLANFGFPNQESSTMDSQNRNPKQNNNTHNIYANLRNNHPYLVQDFKPSKELLNNCYNLSETVKLKVIKALIEDPKIKDNLYSIYFPIIIELPLTKQVLDKRAFFEKVNLGKSKFYRLKKEFNHHIYFERYDRFTMIDLMPLFEHYNINIIENCTIFSHPVDSQFGKPLDSQFGNPPPLSILSSLKKEKEFLEEKKDKKIGFQKKQLIMSCFRRLSYFEDFRDTGEYRPNFISLLEPHLNELKDKDKICSLILMTLDKKVSNSIAYFATCLKKSNPENKYLKEGEMLSKFDLSDFIERIGEPSYLEIKEIMTLLRMQSSDERQTDTHKLKECLVESERFMDNIRSLFKTSLN